MPSDYDNKHVGPFAPGEPQADGWYENVQDLGRMIRDGIEPTLYNAIGHAVPWLAPAYGAAALYNNYVAPALRYRPGYDVAPAAAMAADRAYRVPGVRRRLDFG